MLRLRRDIEDVLEDFASAGERDRSEIVHSLATLEPSHLPRDSSFILLGWGSGDRFVRPVVECSIMGKGGFAGGLAGDRSGTSQDREELVRARQRIEYILSATTAVTYTCEASPPFGATFVSENVRTVLGHAPHAFTESPTFWADHIHPDERDAVLAGVARVFETGHHVHEYRFARADGTYCWIHDDLVLARDDDGAPREMIGCMLDVTSRREAEDARRRSETSFRRLIEQVPLAVLVHRDGRIVYANPALLALLGYASVADLLGRSPLDLVVSARHGLVASRIRQLDADRMFARTPSLETELVHADGSPVSVEVEAFKLDFGGAPAIVALVRDLRERREMLARLAAADRLASVGMLAAGVAHEINNPLAYVQSNLALVSDALPRLLGRGAAPRFSPEEVDLLLRDAREGAERIRAVVADLRMLSQPGNPEAYAGPVEIEPVLQSCLRIAEKEIGHRARLTVNLGEIPPVRGDRSRISQVFLNLLVNSAQSIAEGRRDDNEIRVTAFRAASSQVVVEFLDTGCGIPSEILGRIFDPFFTTKPVGVGMGLGLSICHSIVKAMGGQLLVDSEVGRGSTFCVVLQPFTSDLPPASERPVPSAVRRARVLLIDDERALGHSLRLLLSEHHDVDATTSAKEAMARLEAGTGYDVILCDLMMPEMSGMDFYDRLKATAPSMVSRVAFLTGGAFTRASREFLERVPNPRLEKPFALSALLDLVRRTAGSGARTEPSRA